MLSIITCIKVVPKPEEVVVNQKTFTIDRTKARSEINPADMNAIEVALSLKEKYNAKVTVLSMGPPFFETYLKLFLMMGADDVVLLSDRSFAGADTLATSYTLAKGIEKIGKYDIIICGEESSDGATSQVPPGIAEWLNVPQITYAKELDIDKYENTIKARRETTKINELISVKMPAVVSVVTGANEPRFMNYDKKQFMEEFKVKVWNANDIEADQECIGFVGSPTSVAGVKTLKPPERRKEKITGSSSEKAEKLAKIIKSII